MRVTSSCSNIMVKLILTAAAHKERNIRYIILMHKEDVCYFLSFVYLHVFAIEELYCHNQQM